MGQNVDMLVVKFERSERHLQDEQRRHRLYLAIEKSDKYCCLSRVWHGPHQFLQGIQFQLAITAIDPSYT